MRRSAETPLRNKERETIMLFELLKRSPRPVVSLLTPASGQGYALPMSGLIGYMRGTPMQESATAGQAELADGSKPFAGFMTRDSQGGGGVLGDMIYPNRLELPFVAGEDGSFEFAEEVVAEGANLIDAGLTAATPLKTAISFAAGKFAVAISGQDAQFVLVGLPAPETAGSVRARFVTMAGSMKP